MTGLSISSWLTVLVRYTMSVSSYAILRFQRRKTGNGPTVVCSPEPLDLVACRRICTPYSVHAHSDMDAGVAPAGKKRLTLLAGKWEQTAAYTGCSSLWSGAGDGSCTHCAAISLGFPAAVHFRWREKHSFEAGRASVGEVNGQSFQPPD